MEETARVLGISPEAAQKRASRGIERLRKYFVKVGIMVSVAEAASMTTEHTASAALLSSASVASNTAQPVAPIGHILVLFKGALKKWRSSR